MITPKVSILLEENGGYVLGFDLTFIYRSTTKTGQDSRAKFLGKIWGFNSKRSIKPEVI